MVFIASPNNKIMKKVLEKNAEWQKSAILRADLKI